MIQRVLLALMLFYALPAHAGERDIVVGVEDVDNYPAYALLDDEYVGAARDILDAFARDRNYQITYRALPIKRLYNELRLGGVDAKFPDSPNWGGSFKTGQTITYSEPVIRFVDGVMVPPGEAGQGAEAVKVLGTVSGFTPFAWNDLIRDGKVTVKENPRMELLLRQAILRRVDGAYVSVAAASHQLEKMLRMPGALIFDPSLPFSQDSYRLSSNTRPELVTEFDAWMAENAETVKKIKAAYGAEKGVR